MQEFIEYLKVFNSSWTTENSQEVELEVDQDILTFLVDFAEKQGVCLDTLIGAILSFETSKYKDSVNAKV